MSKTLHITNGDCAVDVLKLAGIEGDYLPWRDVLHEGPVPAKLSLTELSQVRAKYIADCRWAKLEAVKADFAKRDEKVLDARTCDEVILWFEHDLYDQLQLIQVLSILAPEEQSPEMTAYGDASGTVFSLAQADEYISELSTQQALKLYRERKRISSQQTVLASRAWEAFRSDCPLELSGLITDGDSSLEYLSAAIRRLLQEYPSKERGLSRTEHTILTVLNNGPLEWKDAFKEYQKTEEARFLGDLQFQNTITRLKTCRAPLIRKDNNTGLLSVTKHGMEVLSGKWHPWGPDLNRWIGGVHLSGEEIWVWDESTQVLLKQNNRR